MAKAAEKEIESNPTKGFDMAVQLLVLQQLTAKLDLLSVALVARMQQVSANDSARFTRQESEAAACEARTAELHALDVRERVLRLDRETERFAAEAAARKAASKSTKSNNGATAPKLDYED
jgi:hypothetical protein